MKVLGVGFVLFFFAGPLFAAPPVDCRKLWELEKELGCFAYSPGQWNTEPEKKEFAMESQFGPSACKASNKIDGAKKELKGECEAWLKERRSDLGPKYRTGTCNTRCDSCGQGLERCMITGLVHYGEAP